MVVYGLMVKDLHHRFMYIQVRKPTLQFLSRRESKRGTTESGGEETIK